MGIGSVAGIMGAAGVALAALGAHRSGNPNVTTAAYFLLFHAAALVGLCALSKDRAGRAVASAASILALGTILFAGELAVHALAGLSPVPLAAPIGGFLMITGWLVIAFAVPATLTHSK